MQPSDHKLETMIREIIAIRDAEIARIQAEFDVAITALEQVRNRGTQLPPPVKIATSSPLPRATVEPKVASPSNSDALPKGPSDIAREFIRDHVGTFTVDDLLREAREKGAPASRQAMSTFLKRAVINQLVVRERVGTAHSPTLFKVRQKTGQSH